mgnify:CR=1 FL=1
MCGLDFKFGLHHLQPDLLNPPHTSVRAACSLSGHEIFNPHGPLKRPLNARADRRPPYPAQIWGGYGAPGHVRHVGPDSPTPSQSAPNPPRRPAGSICYLLSSSSSAPSLSRSAATAAPQPFPGSSPPAPKEPSRPRRGGRHRRPGHHRGTSGNSPAPPCA